MKSFKIILVKQNPSVLFKKYKLEFFFIIIISMMVRKITLSRSASRYWTIISPTTQKQRWFVLVGSTTGKQHYLNFSVVPMLGQYQWPNNGVLPQLQLLPRVDPTIDCYLGAYSTISISIPHTHTQIHHISY